VYEKRRKRIWVQQVAVAAEALETRLEVARARGLKPDADAAAHGVAEFIKRSRDAALRHDPIPGRWGNWWRGTLVEAAYRNLHAARAQLVDLYDEADLAAEVPSAISRAQATMHREDPRCIAVADLEALPVPKRRARLRALIEDGYEGLDQQHAQLRSFRNIVLLSALVIAALVGVTVLVVSLHPSVMPLCFPHEIITAKGTVEHGLNCPTRSRTTAPSGGDVLIVALLGLLGGALAASVSIRNLKGTSTPYDVPVALAMLKGPLGAFTAIVGLVAIQGDFIPGLSVLDSQEQILAYALILGYAQQVFTRQLDHRAQTLLSGLPSRDASVRPEPATKASGSKGGATRGSAATADTAAGGGPDAGGGTAAGGDPGAAGGEAAEAGADDGLGGGDDEGAADGEEAADDDNTVQTGFLDNPDGDEEGQKQDDEQVDVMPEAPEQDTR
jgi:hypothetical protein